MIGGSEGNGSASLTPSPVRSIFSGKARPFKRDVKLLYGRGGVGPKQVSRLGYTGANAPGKLHVLPPLPTTNNTIEANTCFRGNSEQFRDVIQRGMRRETDGTHCQPLTAPVSVNDAPDVCPGGCVGRIVQSEATDKYETAQTTREKYFVSTAGPQKHTPASGWNMRRDRTKET